MNKKLKDKLIKHNEEMRAAFPHLYDQEWVEEEADKGWKELVEGLKNVYPKLGEIADRKEGYNVFAVIYYSAFESAINGFIHRCLEDSITDIHLSLNKLQELSAEIITLKQS